MISIGVVGYGYWGPNLARNAAEATGAQLRAIADISALNLAKAKKRHPSATLYASWQELVNDTEVDAVIIATPVESHFAIALAALKAGKHVLVEKPMTRSLEEADILIREAAKRRLTLMVDHTFVYSPAVRKIRELITDGSIGDIYYYDSTRVNLGLFQRDVNVIWDLAVHDLAILEYLMDARPVAVTASGAGNIHGSPENIAHVSLFLEGGAVAHLNVNWLAPVKVRQTLIGGSRKMIVYNDLEPSEKIKVYDRGVNVSGEAQDIQDMRVSYRLGDMWSPQLAVTEALSTELDHFIACVDQGARPLTSGESGRNVVQMLECATLSLRQRGVPIEFQPLRIAS